LLYEAIVSPRTGHLIAYACGGGSKTNKVSFRSLYCPDNVLFFHIADFYVLLLGDFLYLL